MNKTYYEIINEIVEPQRMWFSDIVEPTVEALPPFMQSGNAENLASYRLNNYGLRCDDFNETPKNHILFGGCELTMPMDIEEDEGWAKKLYLQLDSNSGNFRNLCYPGASVEKIVSNVFKYCKQFGNPEKLFLYLPDVTRDIGFWVESKAFKPKLFYQNDINQEGGKEHNEMAEPKNLPVEITIIRYLHFVRALEQYCEASNIDLYWTSWDNHTNDLLFNFNFKYLFKNTASNNRNQDDIFNMFVTEIKNKNVK